jgi:hypothetical protein
MTDAINAVIILEKGYFTGNQPAIIFIRLEHKPNFLLLEMVFFVSGWI